MLGLNIWILMHHMLTNNVYVSNPNTTITPEK